MVCHSLLPSLAGVHPPHTRPGGHQVLGGQPGQDGNPRPGVCSTLHPRWCLSRTPPVCGAHTLPPHSPPLPRSLCGRHGGKVGTKRPRQRVSWIVSKRMVAETKTSLKVCEVLPLCHSSGESAEQNSRCYSRGSICDSFQGCHDQTKHTLSSSYLLSISSAVSLHLFLLSSFYFLCHSLFLSLILSQDPSKRFGASLGVLSSGRVGITELCVTNLRLAVCIAIR